MQIQLNRHKIKTTSDFFNTSLNDLSAWFGHPGRAWYFRLRGWELDEVASSTKSVGHSHVLAPEFRTKSFARRVLSKMAEKCAKRLRSKGLWANAVRVSVSFLGGGGFSQLVKTNLVCDSRSIRSAALLVYDKAQISKTPLKVSVTLFDLKQMSSQPISLFKDIEKSKRVSETLDRINDRFGDDTIYCGAQFGTEDAAPNRIPFGDPGRLSF